MSGTTIASLAFLAFALVLPVLALRGRSVDFASGWKMAAIWGALFLLTVMVFKWAGM